ALSSPNVRQRCEEYLIEREFRSSTLEHVFSAIHKVIDYTSWHKIALGLARIEINKEVRRFNDIGRQQTLVIPERLCRAIYGKAMALIEEALPHAALIAETEHNLQDNYMQGKQVTEDKMKANGVFTFINSDGSINNHKLANA
ncbi:hypothetical protein EA007_27425, partial [Vibrio anguillarum]|nr:hypothetical protein [Vibrio anguillarum]